MHDTAPLIAPRSTAEWQSADSAHFLHPFTDHAALRRRGSRVIERGSGIYLHDTDGHRLLDAMAGLWCVNVGYGRRELIDAAAQQMERLAFYNAFFETTTPPAVALAERLAELAGPRFQHVFFTNSGSEANDTVVRLVRRYWELQGQPQRKVIISRSCAYHGSTIAGASLGGMGEMHGQGGIPIPDIEHIQYPYAFEFRPAGMSDDEFGLMAARWLEEGIAQLGADRVAAFIGEPVQGAGGVIVPPATYWPEVQRICERHGVLLVSDEVICGFGRTGPWFGCEAMGFEPDLMSFAKGVTSGYVPLGGVMVGERVARVLIDQGGGFSHGFTYSGHPVACAVALANLQVMHQEQMLEHVRGTLSPLLAQEFQALASGPGKHPLVGAADTCGMMAALHLTREDRTAFPVAHAVGTRCRDHCFEVGVVMRSVGDRMVIAPPLMMTAAQVGEMMGLIRQALDRTLDELRSEGLA